MFFKHSRTARYRLYIALAFMRYQICMLSQSVLIQQVSRPVIGGNTSQICPWYKILKMYICKIRHLFSGSSSNIMFWPIYRTTRSMFFLENLAFIGVTFARFWRAYWIHANMTLMLPRSMEPTYKYIYICVMNMAKITNSPSGLIFSFRNHAEQVLQWLSRPLGWLTAFRWQTPRAYV